MGICLWKLETVFVTNNVTDYGANASCCDRYAFGGGGDGETKGRNMSNMYEGEIGWLK